MPEMMPDAVAPQGLSWSWELDFDVLLAAMADAARPAVGGSGAGPSDTGPGRGGPPGGNSARADSPRGGSSAADSPRDGSSAADSPRGGSSAGDASGDGSSPAGSPGDAASGDAARRADDPVRRESAQGAVLDDLHAAQADDDLDGAGPPDGAGPGLADDAGARLPAGALAGRVAERLAPGPDLAAWLAMAPAASLGAGDLAAVAGSWRRVAAWAQARELAAVAQIASRAAARDKDIGTGPDGRPARVPVSAAAEVALELTMSQYGASWWTDLAVTLGWRLAATGAALNAGVIDLSRARLIAEATGTLSDEVARAVEERVLPAAGEQTTGMLRAALRRAVIAADPQGAEERRKESERRAKVVLYPDEENTATLAGQRLPTVHAAAAMARIKAMARALKASGAGGGMDLLCAQVYVGLLLGTLPLIPPAQGAPPDDPPGPPGADPPGPPTPPGPPDPPAADPPSPEDPPAPPDAGPADPPDPPAADPPSPADPPAPPGPPGDVPGQGPPRGSGQRPPRGSGSPGAAPAEPAGDNPDDHDPGLPRAGGPGGGPDNGQSAGPRAAAGAGPPRRDAPPPGDSPVGQGPRDRPSASGTPPGTSPAGQRPRDRPPPSGTPPGTSPAGRGPHDRPPASGTPPGDSPPASDNPPSANDPPPPDMPPPGQHPPTNDMPPSRDRPPAGSDPPPGHDRSPADVPPPGDADAPRDEDDYPCPDDGTVPGGWASPGQDDDDDGSPAAAWPGLPAVIPSAFARPGGTADGACPAEARPGDARPGDGAQPDGAQPDGARPGGNRSGLLDVSLPWQVLAGISAGPGHLGRIGPVTATQARRIAECAAGDPGAEWRIIVTTPEGAALAVTRIPRPRDRRRVSLPGLDSGIGTAGGIELAAGIGTAAGVRTATGVRTAAGIGLVSRVTLTIPEDLAADPPRLQGPEAVPGPAGGILDLAVRAAARAAARARAAAAADAAAGGCAHDAASSSYRPPPRLQEYIAARDLTCRFLRCRQPAWRGDLDHTIAFDDGGITCRCNLGALCRMHHIIKHHPDWKLEQLAPGIFRWTAPSGRTFTAIPDTHFA